MINRIVFRSKKYLRVLMCRRRQLDMSFNISIMCSHICVKFYCDNMLKYLISISHIIMKFYLSFAELWVLSGVAFKQEVIKNPITHKTIIISYIHIHFQRKQNISVLQSKEQLWLWRFFWYMIWLIYTQLTYPQSFFPCHGSIQLKVLLCLNIVRNLRSMDLQDVFFVIIFPNCQHMFL